MFRQQRKILVCCYAGGMGDGMCAAVHPFWEYHPRRSQPQQRPPQVGVDSLGPVTQVLCRGQLPQGVLRPRERFQRQGASAAAVRWFRFRNRVEYFRDTLLLWVQVCLDKRDTITPEPGRNRTSFGRRTPAYWLTYRFYKLDTFLTPDLSCISRYTCIV